MVKRKKSPFDVVELMHYFVVESRKRMGEANNPFTFMMNHSSFVELITAWFHVGFQIHG
jgi:hypothetical protein